MTQFYDAQMRKLGVNPNQGSMLGALYARESWSMAELSESLGMERHHAGAKSAAAGAGWFSWKSTGGGRGNLVELSITAKGRKQVEKLMPAWSAAQQTMVGHARGGRAVVRNSLRSREGCISFEE